jgi:RNA-directed DNA polymerase
MDNLYKCLHSTKEKYLVRAWQKVRANGIASSSKDTRDETKRFEEIAPLELQKIQRQLQENRFHFANQRGIPIKKHKGSGKVRPVVLAPIKNRIVQRALLDLLQDKVPAVKNVLDTKTSIGGVPGRGTKHAISIINAAIADGATYFSSSDISGFFTKIPRQNIINFIADQSNDPRLADLFQRGINTTLENEKELGAHKDLFPIDDIGVAQGSPLSPLIGNILLNEFDRSLNDRGITCVRYIDDFVILGPSAKKVNKAMASATKMLSDFGMSVYDPIKSPNKAASGLVSKGFNFLGCHINPGQVAPSREARAKLLAKVDGLLKDGERAVRLAAKSDGQIELKHCQIQTLIHLDGVLRGWGHAFSFCNTPQVFDDLDAKTDEAVSKFMSLCHSLGSKKNVKQRRRILGVGLLSDTLS